MTDELKKALDDYRAGRMIIVTDDEKRENEADLVFLHNLLLRTNLHS